MIFTLDNSNGSANILQRIARALPATILLAALAAPLTASATPHSRVENQRDRIQNGYRGGSINRTQYQHDISRLDTIRQKMQADRRQNDGHLTSLERHQFYQKLNRNGEHINDQRHNQPPA